MHARNMTNMIKKDEKKWQGVSSVGADSYAVTQEKMFQAHISDAHNSNDQQRMVHYRPAMPVQTFVQQKLQENAPLRQGPRSELTLAGTANVPADDWRIMQAKKATNLGANAAHGVRNRYNLAGHNEAPKSSGVEGWETKFYIDAKKVTKGAISKPWMGVKHNVTKDSVHITESKQYQANVSPPDKKGYQGIMPHIPKEDYVIAAYRDVKETMSYLAKGSKGRPPQVGPDALMFEQAKSAEAAKTSGEAAKGTRWPFSGGLIGTLSQRRGTASSRGQVVAI